MTEPAALELMKSAWSLRREALDAQPGARPRLLADARRRLTHAASLLDGGPDRVVRAQALHLLAHVEVDDENAARAEAYWADAIEILRGADDPLALAHKLRHLGDLLREQGRIDEAAPLLEEALALHREQAVLGEEDEGTRLDLANTVRRVALLREAEADPTAASELWEEARGLYGALQLTDGVTEAEEHLAALRGAAES